MNNLEDIEILRVKYRTLDNGACGVDVEWTTPELKPSGKFALYSLSRDKYDELCKDDELFNWCKQTIYQNEIQKVDIKAIAQKYGDVFIIRCPKCNSRNVVYEYATKYMKCNYCAYQSVDGGEFVEEKME